MPSDPHYKVFTLRLATRYVLVLVALTAGPAAGGIEESRTIRSAVDAFVQAQTESLPGHVEIKSGLVDPQLKFTHCDHLDVFVPPGAKLWGNTTVGVRCEVPEKWSLYVPVQIRVWADVVLSARALPRGQTITADDVAMQRLDLTQLERGVFTELQQVIGKVTKSAVSGGTPLRSDQLRAVAVVTQGQQVRVVFAGAGFHVSSEGRALGNAGVGEPVQVRTASGKLIKGIVTGPGVVQVQ
jgi:flagellar basal body P-ring formation protein FlgA